MTWNAFHHRGEILQTVIDTADLRRDGVLPLDVPGVSETFHGELDLVGALHLKWHARLSGNIERELMTQPMDLQDAIARAWAKTSVEAPGIRMIIDRYTETPTDAQMADALQRARTKEWLKLAAAAGLSSDESASSARAGEQVELKGRAAVGQPASQNIDDVVTPSLVDRIKAVLAA
ncbi:hypothetical protein [Marmoricola sp. RAF53]|uniref:hypothetical protein n=1 Tax=Marmoricola sp. RAF53 TaxID=3233059 RepID=UPI003F9D91F9